MRPITQDHEPVEGQAWFRAIPVNELIDGVTISPLRILRSEAVQDCGFGVFKVGQAQDGLGDVASSSGTWLLFHDRWPPNHRSMIRVVPRCEVRVARHPLENGPAIIDLQSRIPEPRSRVD